MENNTVNEQTSILRDNPESDVTKESESTPPGRIPPQPSSDDDFLTSQDAEGENTTQSSDSDGQNDDLIKAIKEGECRGGEKQPLMPKPSQESNRKQVKQMLFERKAIASVILSSVRSVIDELGEGYKERIIESATTSLLSQENGVLDSGDKSNTAQSPEDVKQIIESHLSGDEGQHSIMSLGKKRNTPADRLVKLLGEQLSESKNGGVINNINNLKTTIKQEIAEEDRVKEIKSTISKTLIDIKTEIQKTGMIQGMPKGLAEYITGKLDIKEGDNNLKNKLASLFGNFKSDEIGDNVIDIIATKTTSETDFEEFKSDILKKYREVLQKTYSEQIIPNIKFHLGLINNEDSDVEVKDDVKNILKDIITSALTVEAKKADLLEENKTIADNEALENLKKDILVKLDLKEFDGFNSGTMIFTEEDKISKDMSSECSILAIKVKDSIMRHKEFLNIVTPLVEIDSKEQRDNVAGYIINSLDGVDDKTKIADEYKEGVEKNIKEYLDVCVADPDNLVGRRESLKTFIEEVPQDVIGGAGRRTKLEKIVGEAVKSHEQKLQEIITNQRKLDQLLTRINKIKVKDVSINQLKQLKEGEEFLNKIANNSNVYDKYNEVSKKIKQRILGKELYDVIPTKEDLDSNRDEFNKLNQLFNINGVKNGEIIKQLNVLKDNIIDTSKYDEKIAQFKAYFDVIDESKNSIFTRYDESKQLYERISHLLKRVEEREKRRLEEVYTDAISMLEKNEEEYQAKEQAKEQAKKELSKSMKSLPILASHCPKPEEGPQKPFRTMTLEDGFEVYVRQETEGGKVTRTDGQMTIYKKEGGVFKHLSSKANDFVSTVKGISDFVNGLRKGQFNNLQVAEYTYLSSDGKGHLTVQNKDAQGGFGEPKELDVMSPEGAATYEAMTKLDLDTSLFRKHVASSLLRKLQEDITRGDCNSSEQRGVVSSFVSELAKYAPETKREEISQRVGNYLVAVEENLKEQAIERLISIEGLDLFNARVPVAKAINSAIESVLNKRQVGQEAKYNEARKLLQSIKNLSEDRNADFREILIDTAIESMKLTKEATVKGEASQEDMVRNSIGGTLQYGFTDANIKSFAGQTQYVDYKMVKKVVEQKFTELKQTSQAAKREARAALSQASKKVSEGKKSWFKGMFSKKAKSASAEETPEEIVPMLNPDQSVNIDQARSCDNNPCMNLIPKASAPEYAENFDRKYDDNNLNVAYALVKGKEYLEQFSNEVKKIVFASDIATETKVNPEFVSNVATSIRDKYCQSFEGSESIFDKTDFLNGDVTKAAGLGLEGDLSTTSNDSVYEIKVESVVMNSIAGQLGLGQGMKISIDLNRFNENYFESNMDDDEKLSQIVTAIRSCNTETLKEFFIGEDSLLKVLNSQDQEMEISMNRDFEYGVFMTKQGESARTFVSTYGQFEQIINGQSVAQGFAQRHTLQSREPVCTMSIKGAQDIDTIQPQTVRGLF